MAGSGVGLMIVMMKISSWYWSYNLFTDDVQLVHHLGIFLPILPLPNLSNVIFPYATSPNDP